MSVQTNLHRPHRAVDVVRGLLALVSVVGLAMGVPVALVAWVGSPLPSEVPALSDVVAALGDAYIPDEFLIKALALVCWVTWLELTISLVVEGVAFARGRKAGAVPLAGGLQRSAARLIATVALLGAVVATKGAPQPSARTAPSLVTGGQPAAALVVDDVSSRPAEPSSDAEPGADADTAAPTYGVRQRDTLWDIAEQHLGDPLRWQEIFQLNEGRPQADGRCLTDPDLILPGWQLQLPADAVGVATPGAPDAPATEEPGEQAPPDAEGPGADGASAEADRAGGEAPSDEVQAGDDVQTGDEVTAGDEARTDDEVTVAPGEWPEAEAPFDEAPVAPDEVTPSGDPDPSRSEADLSSARDGGMVLIDDGGAPADESLDDAVLVLETSPVLGEADGAARAAQDDDEADGDEDVGSAGEAEGGAEGDGGATRSTSPAAAGGDEAPSPTEVTVEPGDNLWAMAEAQLAVAWGRQPTDAEVVAHWQASVEQNRPRLAPPGDPDLIYPGQVLVAPTPPDDPTVIRPVAPPTEAGRPAADDVPAGTGGDHAPADSPPGTDRIEGTASTDADGRDGGEATASEDPHARDEGVGDGDVPPTDADTEADGSAASPDVAQGRITDTTPVDAEDAAVDGSESAPVGLIGGGVAVAGVLVLLERRRRAQQRHRRKGRVVPLSPPHVRDGEHQLRWGADIEGARLLDVALRAAAAGAGATGLPLIRWAEARGDAAVLVLTEPSPAPPGFVALDPDRWMTTATADELALLAAHAAAPVPTLTPVGTTEVGHELLVELESSGVTTVGGAEEDAVGLLRAIVVAASTAVWADQARIVSVGFEPDVARLPGVGSVPSLAEALDLAEAHAAHTEAALRSLRCPTIGQARAAGATPESWDPLLVVAAVPPRDRSDQRRLEALAERPNSAVGVVTLPGLDAGLGGRSFAIGGHGWLEIDGIAEAVRPRYLGREDVRALVEVLADASGRADEEPGGATATLAPRRPPPVLVADGAGRAGRPDDAGEPPPPPVLVADGSGDPEGTGGRPVSPVPIGDDADGAPEAPVGIVPALRSVDLLGDVDVLVRVLGEVEAVRRVPDGDRISEVKLVPTRQRALEAIAYLALRESAVDREDLEISLFPHGANAAKTLYNTVSAARALVGDALFPSSGSGRYELSPAVVTDYGLFCEMVATADEVDDAAAAADLLAEALTLVRGEPFTGVGRGYAWVGPHRGMIVTQVVDAAEELAEVRLAMGDWRSAEWAARQGLRAFPSDERMYRLLMRTARAAGNIPGVQRVFRELCDVLADPDLGVEPEDTLHPETIELLEELTGATPRHGRMGA